MASGNVSARYGTAASDKTAHFDLNLAGKNIASLTSVTYSNFDDLHAGGTPNKDNKYGSFGFRPIYQETINGVDTIIVNPDSTKQVASGYSQYDILEKSCINQMRIFRIYSICNSQILLMYLDMIA